MSAERLSYLKALHCVRLWAGEWRQPELGNHCGVNGLLLGGYIVSPTVYFPLYISKLAVVFFSCTCSFVNRKRVEKYEQYGNVFT